MARTALAVLFFLAAGATAWAGKAASLRVLTINVWSGLDYRGTISCGEYESPTRREARFEILVRQIKALDPDVVFVQEANGKPARPYCSRLARALGYDQIHQICLAGIKLGWVGIPFNLNEGNGILAKRTLHLEKLDEWKLSGLPGIYSDFGSFHLDETISAVVGRVRVNDVPLYLVCVHLSAGPPDDARLEDSLQVLHEHYGFSEKELKQAEKMQQARLKRRADEARRLVTHLRQLSESSPLIVAGDFNSVPDSRVIRSFIVQSGCFDAFAVQDTTAGATWDPRNNENTALSARRVDARGRKLNAWGALDAVGCSFPSRYDYVFLRPPFQKEDVLQSRVVMDSAGVWREPNGDTLRVHASDHYGVLTDVNLDRVLADAPRETDRVEPCTRKTTEAFPIVMYDTDIGYGFGAKLFARHWLGRSESLDLTLFSSSKGERWFKAVFSIPDQQIRQRKRYPVALDVTAEYDKWIRNSFFGVGNDSRYEDREYYTREPYSFTATVSRGFTSRVIGELTLAHKVVRNYHFEEGSRLATLPPKLNHGRVYTTSLGGSLRYDSRDDFLNPSRGVVLRGDFEWAPKKFGNVKLTRWCGTAQSYAVLFYPRTVLALRAQMQEVQKPPYVESYVPVDQGLPIQVLPSIGGNSTLRGSPQDRYLDYAAVVLNAELRFPIWWRFGGVVGMDAGRVAEYVSAISLDRWASNPAIGLRFYMNTFLARVDVGLGHETTGLYFNFGHAF